MRTTQWRGTVLIGLIAAAGCNAPGKPRPDDQVERPEQVMDFGKLYARNCSGCHGADGRLGPAPPLNDPFFLAIVPDAVLLKTIVEGRAGTPMPPFDQARGGPLTAEQVRVLAEGIKRRWQLAGVSPDSVPAYAAASSSGGASVARGKAAFTRACAGCHGDDGEGGKFNGQAVGTINDAAFLTLCSDQVLRRYVITGRPDLGMPGFSDPRGRPAGFRPLAAQDVTDLSALLASWRKDGAAGSGAAAGRIARGESPVP